VKTTYAVFWLLLLGNLSITANAQQSCPSVPVVDITSSDIPMDVCVPAGFGQQNPIDFFDDYSWKAFIALVWPAESGHRGKPDRQRKVSDLGTRVFETYKPLWEVFRPDGALPEEWNSTSNNNACHLKPAPDDLVLASFSKFGDIGQAGVGTLVGPLVVQNRTYVRYLTAFNQVEFDDIRSRKLFLRANLPVAPNALTMPDGSIDLKTSWIEMDHIANPQRFYTRSAIVLDPATGECTKKSVGLVGFHIVQKTPSRPQWIWTTFEQVDNVSLTSTSAATFNDGSGADMPATNPYSVSPLPLPTPPPYNVVRVKPIHPNTAATNLAYQKALRDSGSVWQFYQLVMTQWPLAIKQPAVAGTPQNTFPGRNTDSTAFSNTTLETFDQQDILGGCMN